MTERLFSNMIEVNAHNDRVRKSRLGLVPDQTPVLLEKLSKYRNVKTGCYASKREAKRAAELKLMESTGQIKNLREQVPFLLIPKQEGERSIKYVADFVYDEPIVGNGDNAQRIVEDCKGMRTRDYVIKRKLMLFVHGIRIKET